MKKPGFIKTFSRVNPKRRKHAPEKLNNHRNLTKSTSFLFTITCSQLPQLAHRSYPRPFPCHCPLCSAGVNPHREQQTTPQGDTSSPPKYFFTPTAKARPDQVALATSAEARGATHRARPQTPSRSLFWRAHHQRPTPSFSLGVLQCDARRIPQ